jgi:hypothetical protein
MKDENDLRARTKDFALRVIRMFAALPKRAEAQVLGKQVLRSGTSVGANYREAFRARSKAEFISKAGDFKRMASLIVMPSVARSEPRFIWSRSPLSIWTSSSKSTLHWVRSS